MKPDRIKPFTLSEYSTEWLKTFRAMFPGGASSPVKEPTPKEAQVAANQEWEHEGGCITPEKAPAPAQAPVPKIPF